MSYFIYVISSLCLIACQTALIPRLGFIGHFFDVMLPWVIYLAAFRPAHDTLPFVVFVGVLMDTLSGGPFGLYLSSYVWLFIAVRIATAVVRTENPMVMILILIGAVALQNGIFLIAIDIPSTGRYYTGERVRVVGEQIGWVLLTGPLFALGMRHTEGLTRRRTRKISVDPASKE